MSTILASIVGVLFGLYLGTGLMLARDAWRENRRTIGQDVIELLALPLFWAPLLGLSVLRRAGKVDRTNPGLRDRKAYVERWKDGDGS